MSLLLGSGSAIEFYSGSYMTTSSLIAKWEIDPDDGKSIQLRMPSESFDPSGTDRIAFYVSASGEIGVNTKTPQSSFDFVPIGTKKVIQGKTKITGSMDITGDITSSGTISSSGYLYVAGFDGGTF